MTKYVDDKYKVADNPIINPIDLKVAKDNPYVMKELLGKKMLTERGNNNNGTKGTYGLTPSSYLSRRGSSSLTRLIY